MTNILITGGAGYIGSHAVYAALEAGFNVTVIDNLSTGRRENMPLKDIVFLEADLADQDRIGAILSETRPQTVIHFAGSVVVPESVSNPIKYYKNNVAASLSLIHACVRADVSSFLFSSSAAVYDASADARVTEDSPCRPLNPYGWSKFMVEQILADTGAAHGMPYAALRYFNVAGADPKGRTGQCAEEATHLIRVCCQAALGLRGGVSIFGTDFNTPDGTGVRDYIHVTDLVEAHFALIANLEKTGKSCILNCGNGRGYSVRDVIAAVQKTAGHSFSVTEAARRPGDPPSLIADPSRLQALTGWRALHTDLADIVASSYGWEEKIAAARA